MGASQSGEKNRTPITSSKSQNNNSKDSKLTSSEIRLLSRKLSGDKSVEKNQSHASFRYNIIDSFVKCYFEYLEIPTADTRHLEEKYASYKKVIHWQVESDGLAESPAMMNESWLDYVSLDFSAARRIYKSKRLSKSYMQMLDAIEESFKYGIVPPTYKPSLDFPAKYGTESLKMVNFFRALKNDDVSCRVRGETFILLAILDFLEQYESAGKEQSRRSLLISLKNTSNLYKNKFTATYGTMRPQLSERFIRIDLQNLNARLKTEGARECEIELARIVVEYLIRGQISDVAWMWLSRNVAPRQDWYSTGQTD